MSTYFYESLESFQNRWKEIETLIKLANTNRKNEEDYNTLCRAIIVLMVAHLEGTVRDTVKAIIEDFNLNSTFLSLPLSMKRIFCKEFISGPEEKESKDLELRTQKLIAQFDCLSPTIIPDPFLIDGKNPSPTIIHRVVKNFGANNFFSLIGESNFDLPFQGENRKVGQLKRRIREHLYSASTHYPYNIKSKLIKLNNNKLQSPTLWEDFVNDLLTIRHGIAHGSSVTNGKSLREIKEIRIKLEILEYAFMYVMCITIMNPTN